MTISTQKTSGLRHQIITLLAPFSLLFCLFISSCNDDDPAAPAEVAKTEFYLNDAYSHSTMTESNRTKWGEIIKVISDRGDLYLILSDTTESLYSNADTLFGNSTGKVKCILSNNGTYSYSTDATVSYDRLKKTGSFSLGFGNMMITKGKLVVDTVVWKPCIDFTKISRTDNQGVPMNTPDPDDWVIRSEWTNPLEAQIFKLKNPATSAWTEYAVAFPNPCGSSILLDFSDNIQGFTADCLLVNQNMEVEQVFTNVPTSMVAFHFESQSYSGNYYRFYTCLHNSANSYYGSGDLLFQ